MCIERPGLCLALVLASIGTACEREPTLERAVEPAAEQPALGPEAEPIPASPAPAVGYDPDSLSWLQEGRPVEFGGREWAPVGRPFQQSAAALRPVGAFEGMVLYAAVNEPPPFNHLFFPYGNDVWQTLEPADSSP